MVPIVFFPSAKEVNWERETLCAISESEAENGSTTEPESVETMELFNSLAIDGSYLVLGALVGILILFLPLTQ